MAYITKDGKIIRGDTEKPSTKFDMNKIHEIAEKLKKEMPPKLNAFQREQASREKINLDDYPGDLTWENADKIITDCAIIILLIWKMN